MMLGMIVNHQTKFIFHRSFLKSGVGKEPSNKMKEMMMLGMLVNHQTEFIFHRSLLNKIFRLGIKT